MTRHYTMWYDIPSPWIPWYVHGRTCSTWSEGFRDFIVQLSTWLCWHGSPPRWGSMSWIIHPFRGISFMAQQYLLDCSMYFDTLRSTKDFILRYQGLWNYSSFSHQFDTHTMLCECWNHVLGLKDLFCSITRQSLGFLYFRQTYFTTILLLIDFTNMHIPLHNCFFHVSVTGYLVSGP